MTHPDRHHHAKGPAHSNCLHNFKPQAAEHSSQLRLISGSKLTCASPPSQPALQSCCLCSPSQLLASLHSSIHVRCSDPVSLRPLEMDKGAASPAQWPQACCLVRLSSYSTTCSDIAKKGMQLRPRCKPSQQQCPEPQCTSMASRSELALCCFLAVDNSRLQICHWLPWVTDWQILSLTGVQPPSIWQLRAWLLLVCSP